MNRWSATFSFLLLLFVTHLLVVTPIRADDWIHPFDYPQSSQAPNEFYAVIEIPAGSFTKYEMDADTGHMLVDRFVRMPVAYPANYGSITQSLSGDDDPLDVLVITRAPIHPGVLIKARPIAVLRTLDGGEQDDKIIAVPADGLDPTYATIREAKDLPELERQRIEAFFQVYKKLKSTDAIEIKGWGDAAAARKMLSTALERYRTQHSADQAAP